MKQQKSQRDPQWKGQAITVRVDQERTSQRINDLCLARGLTVKDLQRELGISRQAIDKWLNGKSLPRTECLVLLAHVLDVRLDDLVIRKRL